MKNDQNLIDELIAIYNEDIEDNDASYGPFGYAFQADAGLILFMKHFSEITNLAIESRLQDIQMKKKNGDLILAQAKSAQKPLKTISEKTKLHDALFSLIKTNNNKSDILIYVSNLRDPLKSNENDIFDLKELNYNDLSFDAEKNIKEQVEKIKSKLETVIKENKKSNAVIEKSKIILKHLEKFNYDKLYFLTIPKYYGSDNREKVIVDEIAKFLAKTMDYGLELSNVMAAKVYMIWHEKVMYNSTVESDSSKKYIKKDDLIWPLVVIFARDINPSRIQEIVDFEITESQETIIKQIADNYFLKLNNFKVVHEILSDYNCYKKNKNPKGITLDFIKNNWTKYCDNFNFLEYDNDIIMCITMLFMFNIIENNKNVEKVLRGGDINEN